VTSTTELARQLGSLGGDIHGSLEECSVPMYVLDRHGRIVWLNDAGEKLLPDATGTKFTTLLPAEEVRNARTHFLRRMRGLEPFQDHETIVATPAGRHEIEISAVPLRKKHQIVGVFGVIRSDRPLPPGEADVTPRLTPRQLDVLRALGAGMTTRQMADQLGLSTETVRNHVRAVLGELGAGSRLEAVLVAYRRGMLDRPGEASA
jgi:DNA-binding CsgD family transcriptional regulator